MEPMSASVPRKVSMHRGIAARTSQSADSIEHSHQEINPRPKHYHVGPVARIVENDMAPPPVPRIVEDDMAPVIPTTKPEIFVLETSSFPNKTETHVETIP